MTDYLKFKALHAPGSPLLIGNVWNVQSALALKALGFQALGPSSAAIAHSLGYEDGEQISFSDVLFIVEKVKNSIRIPLSVDMESGYGKTPEQVAKNIEKLHNLGVVGINIEDSFLDRGERKLKSASEFCTFIEDVLADLARRNLKMFINVRCDAFLLQLPDGLNEAIRRVRLYQELNIDGIFLPGMTSIRDMKQIPAKLPLNVMCMPDLPDFDTLAALGIQRISMGNFLHDAVYRTLDSKIEEILKTQSFRPLCN